MNITKTVALALGASFLAGAAPVRAQAPLSLELTCPGSGDALELVRNYGKRRKDDPAYVNTRRPVNGVAKVSIRDGVGKVLLPKAYVVTGEWRDIRKMTVSEDAIAGKVQIALITSANLEIDRRSGTLTMTAGTSSFVGQCTASDPNARAF